MSPKLNPAVTDAQPDQVQRTDWCEKSEKFEGVGIGDAAAMCYLFCANNGYIWQARLVNRKVNKEPAGTTTETYFFF